MSPTLTAAAQTSPSPRVLLTLTWPGISTATIQRLDPDGVLRNVRTWRTDDVLPCFGSAAVFDAECPLDQAVTYQATSPQGSGAINTNIYFEGGVSSWTGNNGATLASSGTQHHEGSLAMQVTPNGSTASTQALAEEDAVVVNSTYGYTAWLWSTSAFTWQVGISWYTSGHALISQNLTAVALGAGAWTNIAGSAPAPATAAFGRLTVQASGTPAGANLLYVDEAMLTSPAALTVTSSGVTLSSSGSAYLTHPGHPQYAGVATITADGLTETHVARRGIFVPIGTELPIVVSDTRVGASGNLVVLTSTAGDIPRMRSLLLDGGALLLRQPLTWGGDSWWVSIGDAAVERFTKLATDNQRRWTLPYQRVDRPSGATDGAAGQTWADVKATYATWNAEKAAKSTWTALNQSVT